MRLCAVWPSFPFTCCLLFIILTHNLVVSRNFSSIRMLLSAHFLFWEILNLNLTFAVYVMLKLSKVFLSNKVYCLGLHKSRVCFLWLFIWRGCKIFCQLEHEHSRSYCRVTRLNKLLFLFALRKINMQCCPLALHVPPFPSFLVPPFPCSPVTLLPCSPVTSVSLFPCSPVLLLPSSPVSLFSCSLVPLLSCYPVPPLPCFPVNL